MDRRELRRQRKQEQVREEILDAAQHVLLKKGISGFTLSAVARQMQLTKAALYHYFASKEALVFELTYQALDSHSAAVAAAIEPTKSGADALEALIRVAAEYYGNSKDELRLAYMVPQVGGSGSPAFTGHQLERIRPFNERMYGAVAARIHSDQEAGRIARNIDGRRLAFLAHMSVMGTIMVEGLVEVADEAPLIHSHQAMVDELVETFRARLAIGRQ